MGIKVNVSVMKTDSQSITVELFHGNCILVDDIGTETKSIIIQRKKGNIESIENFSVPFGMISYQVYPIVPVNEQALDIFEQTSKPQKEDVSIYDFPYKEPKLENEGTSIKFIVTEPISKIEEAPEVSDATKVIEPTPNKGGRPKGAGRKPLTKPQLKKKYREQYQMRKKRKIEAEKNNNSN